MITPEQKRSVTHFINRLSADLWPDADDHGVPRWQVRKMEMKVTNSGGTEVLATLWLTPGVEGLNVVWADGETVKWPRQAYV